MGWNPFKKSSWTKVGDDINKTVVQPVANTATNAANTVATTVVNTTNTVVTETTKVGNDIAKGATSAYNYSADLAKDTAKVTVSVANTVAKNTEDCAKQGIDVTSDGFKQGTKFAQDAYKEGAEAVQKAAEDAYAWADANACRIGLTMGLTMGIVAYFTPKPAPADPGTVNSTAASATWLAWFASQGAKQATKAETMVLSCSIAYIINEGLFMIPGVKGQVNKNLMFNCLSNSINTTISNPVLWGTPVGVGVAVSSGIAPIVATLICEGVLPKGASAGPDAKAADAGIKLAKDALKKLGM
jgi:hypothetical protein